MNIGSWARADGVVGIVSKVDPDGTVTVFNPGDRQMIVVPTAKCQPLPTGTVEARITVRLDVPHGLAEESMTRWVAALVDPVLRANARAALEEQGMDVGAFAIEPSVEVTEVADQDPTGPGAP